MDRFSFFFTFYGLILGLAVTELLSGFARLVRARAVHKIDAFTALLAIFTFVVICATWIDAFYSRGETRLDFGGLWAPILVATCYYLAATVIFPSDQAEFDRLGDYSNERKGFVVAMFLTAEVLLSVITFEDYVHALAERPAIFWLALLPAFLTTVSLFIGLFLVKSRKASIAILSALILVFVTIYWSGGWFYEMADERFGYLWAQ